jgi:hypothetical protein
VFPWCDKPGRNHDLDHIEDYDDTGPPDQTSSSKLSRLCRFHHRVKTHSELWSYERLADGTYLWTGPHRRHWIVDSKGTTMVTVSPETLPGDVNPAHSDGAFRPIGLHPISCEPRETIAK